MKRITATSIVLALAAMALQPSATLAEPSKATIGEWGSRSDGDGRVRDWWSAASRAEFEKRTAGLVDQFGQYEPV